LRYPKADPVTWGVVLYRNYPRLYRTQIFTMRLPRGGNCFVCRFNTMTGLASLPSGGHVVIAPYVSASQTATPATGWARRSWTTGSRAAPAATSSGSPARAPPWTPPSTPTSRRSSPTSRRSGPTSASRSSFPEKRPFFLEGSELLLSPIQAVYTRTITSPRWGLRGTGKWGRTAYTGLVVEDRGGGSVILPGPNGSDLADQEFRSLVGVARLRRDIGRSVVSLLATDREIRGGGYNRVLGSGFPMASPRPGHHHRAGPLQPHGDAGSARPRGRMERPAAQRPRHRSLVQPPDADSRLVRRRQGFLGRVPDLQRVRAPGRLPLGLRGGGPHLPAGGIPAPHPHLRHREGQEDREGALINREYSFGAGMDGRFNSFMRFRYGFSRVRAGEVIVPRQRLYYNLNASPTRWLNDVSLQGYVGEDADFDNARPGTGADVRLSGTVRPTDHIELRLDTSRRWLDVDPPDQPGGRLFTAQVERVRATYTFTSRIFLRLIAQYVDTRRDPSLYIEETSARDASFSGSALFAYKLNWQTVLFVGYGDNRALSEAETFEREDRQFFLKLSYAFQR
jgi:hypothetical protein